MLYAGCTWLLFSSSPTYSTILASNSRARSFDTGPCAADTAASALLFVRCPGPWTTSRTTGLIISHHRCTANSLHQTINIVTINDQWMVRTLSSLKGYTIKWNHATPHGTRRLTTASARLLIPPVSKIRVLNHCN